MSMLRSRQTPKARRAALARAAARREEMREALEADGYPVCPECLMRMDRTHPGTPLRDCRWTPRTCPTCAREWRVYVRDEGETRRVVGYEQRNDEPGLGAGEGTEAMSKKNEQPKAASKKQGGEKTEKQGKQAKTGTAPTAEPEATTAPTASTTAAEKAPKAPAESPKQPDDSGEEVVFALRIRRADRDLLHEKAGSGKASRVVKALIVAASHNDREAIEQVLTQLHGAR